MIPAPTQEEVRLVLRKNGCVAVDKRTGEVLAAFETEEEARTWRSPAVELVDELRGPLLDEYAVIAGDGVARRVDAATCKGLGTLPLDGLDDWANARVGEGYPPRLIFDLRPDEVTG